MASSCVYQLHALGSSLANINYRAGSDAKISGAKIEPLASETKEGVQSDPGGGGVAGKDRDIDQARMEPLGGHGKPLFYSALLLAKPGELGEILILTPFNRSISKPGAARRLPGRRGS